MLVSFLCNIPCFNRVQLIKTHNAALCVLPECTSDCCRSFSGVSLSADMQTVYAAQDDTTLDNWVKLHCYLLSLAISMVIPEPYAECLL